MSTKDDGHWGNDFLIYYAMALVIAVLVILFSLPQTDVWLSQFVSSYESLLLLKLVTAFLIVLLVDRLFLSLRNCIQN